MATTKKVKGDAKKTSHTPRLRATVVAGAKVDEKKTEVKDDEAEDDEVKDDKSKDNDPKISTPKVENVAATEWRIILKEGSTYEVKGLKFVAGRPLLTTDQKLYEKLKYNGRLLIESTKGGG